MSDMREKSHRLAPERYTGERMVVFTTKVKGSPSLFLDIELADRFAGILIIEAETNRCDVLLACFMPDHLHAIIRGREKTSDALMAFYRFKLRRAFDSIVFIVLHIGRNTSTTTL